MKKFLIAVAVLIAVAAIAIGIAVSRLDPQAISGFAAEQASGALGRKVEIGDVHLAFLPPGVRLQNVRVAGDPGAPQLAEIGSIQLGVALAPLLRGAVELSALTLDRPRIALPAGPDGMPVLPVLPGDKQPGARGPGGAQPPAPPPAAPDGSKPIALSIDRFEIHGGELTTGPWRLRQLEVKGRLPSLSRVQASVGAVLEGMGRLSGGKVQIDGIDSDAPKVKTEGELSDVNLAAIFAALPDMPKDVSIAKGVLSGPVSAELAGAKLQAARADLAIADLEARSGTTEIRGPVKAQLALGERFAVDLGGAQISVPGTLKKPAGGRLSISGPLGATPSLGALKSAVLLIGPAEIPLALALEGKPQRVEIGRTELDLASFAEWLESAPGQVGGKIRSEGLRVTLDPLRVDGALQLDNASLAVDKLPISLSGAIQARGTQLAAEGLSLKLDDQPVLISGSYNLEPGTLDATAQADALDVEKLVAKLRGSSELSGTFNGKVSVRGRPDPTALSGGGELAISDGAIKGFSLMKQFLGQFAEVGLALAAARGKDLSRYEEEKFQKLAGRFTLTPGRVDFESLTLEYRYAVANLRGSVKLPGGELDMRGELVLRKEIGSELSGGQPQVKEQVIPIEGVGGTVSKPKLILSRSNLASLAARYATGGKLQEKLEEKLGKSGADAVKGLLDGVFGGSRKPQEPEPSEPKP